MIIGSSFTEACNTALIRTDLPVLMWRTASVLHQPLISNTKFRCRQGSRMRLNRLVPRSLLSKTWVLLFVCQPHTVRLRVSFLTQYCLVLTNSPLAIRLILKACPTHFPAHWVAPISAVSSSRLKFLLLNCVQYWLLWNNTERITLKRVHYEPTYTSCSNICGISLKHVFYFVNCIV